MNPTASSSRLIEMPRAITAKPLRVASSADFRALVFLLVVEEHPASETSKDGDRYPVCRAADCVSDGVPHEEAEDGHRHLEGRHEQAHLQPLSARKATHPERSGNRKRIEP